VEMAHTPAMGTEYTESPLKKEPLYLDGTAGRREPATLNRLFEDEYRVGHRDLRWAVLMRDDWTCPGLRQEHRLGNW
jgi:hypothetical protein